jgi:hypothetical protein
MIWILGGSACSSGPKPTGRDNASAAHQGSDVEAVAPTGSGTVGDAATVTPPTSAGGVTAANRDPCFVEPDPVPWSRWLEAGIDDRILQICVVEFDGEWESGTRHDVCVGVDLSSGATVRIANKELTPRSEPKGSFVTRAGKPSVCAQDGTCRDAGKRLARALRAPTGDDAVNAVRISADGALAVTRNQSTLATIWNVAGDRPLRRFAPPDMESTYRDYVFYTFLGDLIVGEWAPCAGPCYVHRIYRRDGKVVVGRVDTKTGVLRLRDGRLAVMRDTLEIYDPKRARRVGIIDGVVPPELERIGGQLPGGDGDTSDPLVLLDDGSVAVVFRSDRVIEVAVVDVDRGRVTRRFHVPVCAW